MLIKERLLKVLALFLVIHLGLLGIYFYYQVVRGPQIARQAASIRSRSVPLQEIPRGDILDRNGLPLTGQYIVWAAYCCPRLITNREETVSLLAQTLALEPDQLKRKILKAAQQGQFFWLVKSPLNQEEISRLDAMGLAGVFTAPVKQRYSNDGFCMHLLGQVAPIDAAHWEKLKHNRRYSRADWIGVSGIEKRYEEVLKAAEPAEHLVAVLDARGNLIPGLFLKVRGQRQPEEGKKVVLTIHQGVQQAVEKAMNQGIKKGAVVVMDIKTREVMAMSSRPRYDRHAQAEISSADPDSPFLNKALELYHPGSIFKLVVAIAALEEGLLSPDELFICEGRYVINDQVSIACWQEEGHGLVNLEQALAYSCNSAFIQIGARVGREKLIQYVEKMHLTDNEVIGYPAIQDQGYVKIEPGAPAMGNASIGQQGIAFSPLQVASLIATIADNGYWLPPRLVRGVKDNNGKWISSLVSPSPEQVITPQAAVKLQKMLQLAVEEGTGKSARLAETSTAGKTASSQTGRFYSEDKEILNTWFAGYFPADNPRWAIVVLAEDGASGGQTCAPVFREIARAMLKLVSPT